MLCILFPQCYKSLPRNVIYFFMKREDEDEDEDEDEECEDVDEDED